MSAKHLVICTIAALVGGVYLAFQGNGNWIWTGFFIGAVSGSHVLL
jgi:hypothetical protein